MSHTSLYGPLSVPAISLRPRQAALALGISLSTLERLTRSGAIPVVRQGRIRLYSIAALNEWLRTKGGSHAPET
jgi:excisionase family DNA binding protein